MQSGRLDRWMLGCVILAILLRVSSESTANLSYVLLAVFALFGRAQAIQALTISWLLTMINPGLAPDAAGLSIGRYLVIFSAASSVALRSIGRGGIVVRSINFWTSMLGVFILAHSAFFSAVIDVSVLKILVWIVVVLTLLTAWQNLSRQEYVALFDQVRILLIFLILVSLPLLAIPSIGYLRNGIGFQGVLNHPQAFGPTVALLGALLGGKIIGEKKPRLWDILLLGISLVLVVLSGARTAGVAMVVGLLGAAIFSPMFSGVSRAQMTPGLSSKRFQALLGLCFLGALATGPVLVNQLSGYFFKQSDASTLLDAAEASRGALVEKMVANIQDKPLSGVGFGVASSPAEMEIERDSLLGLPLSVQVEKGVMPIAVVEELGFIGAVAVLLWVLLVLRKGARAGVQNFAVLITLLMVNFGESMLFSVGGMGMLLLVILCGATAGERR